MRRTAIVDIFQNPPKSRLRRSAHGSICFQEGQPFDIDPASDLGRGHFGQSKQTPHHGRTSVGTAAFSAQTARDGLISVVTIMVVWAAFGFLIWATWSPRTSDVRSFSFGNMLVAGCSRSRHPRNPVWNPASVMIAAVAGMSSHKRKQ
jgi:hypothetical protein